jgi:hypothetical protein
MTESVILGSGLHRLKFRQVGRVPDLELLLAQYGPKDGQYTYCLAWMGTNDIGHAYIAWKEWKNDQLPGIE